MEVKNLEFTPDEINELCNLVSTGIIQINENLKLEIELGKEDTIGYVEYCKNHIKTLENIKEKLMYTPYEVK